MVSSDQAQELLGAQVVDADGDKVGTVNEVYLDDSTGAPSWVTVSTGWFGLSESFVPLDQADLSGDQIKVPFSTATIKHAPGHDGEEPLSPRDEDELYRHYGVGPATAGRAATRDRDNDNVGTTSENDNAENPATPVRSDRDAPGSNPDRASTRSGDHLTGGTQRVPTGRARLRKYVVTETQTVTIPVSHEQVRVERVPITDADRGSTGAEIGEDEYAIVLHAERPVVTTEVVPVERVRLDTETVSRTETATGNVRKERVEAANNTSPVALDDDRSSTNPTRLGGRR